MGNLQNNLFKEFGQLIIASIRMSGKGLREREREREREKERELCQLHRSVSERS